MSSEVKKKFNLQDRLKRPEPAAQPPVIEPVPVEDAEPEVNELKITTYLDADLMTRLNVLVARKKAQKKRGDPRVSLKNELNQAIREYLERQDHS